VFRRPNQKLRRCEFILSELSASRQLSGELASAHLPDGNGSDLRLAAFSLRVWPSTLAQTALNAQASARVALPVTWRFAYQTAQ
jgi:hypothetical protein